jgi:ribose transport system substrate-binding protein
MMRKLLAILLVATLLTTGLIAQGTAEKSGEVTLDKVGVTMQTLANPFFVEMVKGVEQAAKEINPDCDVISLSGDNDLGKQTTQIDDLISAGVDLIVLNAVNHEGIGPAVKRAKDAGIVVVAADVGAVGADFVIQSDNWQAGRQAGQYIADRLNGEGNVVILTGDPVTAVFGRVGGAKEIFAKYPGIKILSEDQNGKGQRDVSLDLMSNILTAYDDIDAVFAINDPSAIGAVLAIKQAGRESEMFVVGVDGSADAIAEMKKPNSIFAATPAQTPRKMAMEATRLGFEIMKGNPPPEKEILYPVMLITKDNMDSYTPW